MVTRALGHRCHLYISQTKVFIPLKAQTRVLIQAWVWREGKRGSRMRLIYFLPTRNTASVTTDWEPFFFIFLSLAQQGTRVRPSRPFPLMSWFNFFVFFDCKTPLSIPVSVPQWHSCDWLACRYHVCNRAGLFCAWGRTVTLEKTLPTTLLSLFPKVMKCGPASASYHLSISPFGFCMLLHITHWTCEFKPLNLIYGKLSTHTFPYTGKRI